MNKERNGQHDLVRRFYGEICPMEEDPSAGHSLCYVRYPKIVRFQGHSIPQPAISLKIYRNGMVRNGTSYQRQ